MGQLSRCFFLIVFETLTNIEAVPNIPKTCGIRISPSLHHYHSLTPASSQTPRSCSLTPPPRGPGRESEGQKIENLCVDRQFNRWSRSRMQANQNKEFIQCFPWTDRYSTISNREITSNDDLGRQMTLSQISFPCLLSPHTLQTNMTSHSLEYPFGQLELAVLGMSPPNFHAAPDSSPVWEY